MGIILIGLGIGTDLALKGAFFHIINHAIMKGGLFLCAGILTRVSGTKEISRLQSQKMPLMMVSFTLFASGLIGIPPLNGFVSKFVICYGAVQAEYSLLAFCILAASVISCVYYFRVIQTWFIPQKDPPKNPLQPVKVSRLQTVPVYILAALCLIIGTFPSIGLKISELAAAVVMG